MNRLHRYFSAEEMQMADKHEKVFKSLTIRKMHTKPIMRYHYPPIRMAKVKLVTIANAAENAEKLDH